MQQAGAQHKGMLPPRSLLNKAPSTNVIDASKQFHFLNGKVSKVAHSPIRMLDCMAETSAILSHKEVVTLPRKNNFAHSANIYQLAHSSRITRKISMESRSSAPSPGYWRTLANIPHWHSRNLERGPGSNARGSNDYSEADAFATACASILPLELQIRAHTIRKHANNGENGPASTGSPSQGETPATAARPRTPSALGWKMTVPEAESDNTDSEDNGSFAADGISRLSHVPILAGQRRAYATEAVGPLRERRQSVRIEEDDGSFDLGIFDVDSFDDVSYPQLPSKGGTPGMKLYLNASDIANIIDPGINNRSIRSPHTGSAGTGVGDARYHKIYIPQEFPEPLPLTTRALHNPRPVNEPPNMDYPAIGSSQIDYADTTIGDVEYQRVYIPKNVAIPLPMMTGALPTPNSVHVPLKPAIKVTGKPSIGKVTYQGWWVPAWTEPVKSSHTKPLDSKTVNQLLGSTSVPSRQSTPPRCPGITWGQACTSISQVQPSRELPANPSNVKKKTVPLMTVHVQLGAPALAMGLPTSAVQPQTVHLKLPQDSTIRQLKEMLIYDEKIIISSDRLKLSYRGRYCLDSDAKLTDYGVGNDCLITSDIVPRTGRVVFS